MTHLQFLDELNKTTSAGKQKTQVPSLTPELIMNYDKSYKNRSPQMLVFRYYYLLVP